MSVEFKDHSKEIMAQMERNITKALTAIGQTVVELTTEYMNRKYGKPIYLSGDLMRSVSFDIDAENKKVIIGSNLDYSVWVHNGTHKMPARPFLHDAIMQNIKVIEEVAAEYIGDGFKISVKI